MSAALVYALYNREDTLIDAVAVMVVTKLHEYSVEIKTYGIYSYSDDCIGDWQLDDDEVDAYFKGDGCSHFNRDAYIHFCGVDSVLMDAHRTEATYALASMFLTDYFRYGDFPHDVAPDADFTTLEYVSKVAGWKTRIVRLDDAALERLKAYGHVFSTRMAGDQ